MSDGAEVYEVILGRLHVNGRQLPLGRGLITLALLRAGWRGVEGVIPLELGRKALTHDRRLDFLARQLLGSTLPKAA